MAAILSLASTSHGGHIVLTLAAILSRHSAAILNSITISFSQIGYLKDHRQVLNDYSHSLYIRPQHLTQPLYLVTIPAAHGSTCEASPAPGAHGPSLTSRPGRWRAAWHGVGPSAALPPLWFHSAG